MYVCMYMYIIFVLYIYMYIKYQVIGFWGWRFIDQCLVRI